MRIDLPFRKPTRLKGYDYSAPGAYFVTVCTHGRQELLSEIVGEDAHILPQPKLTEIGNVCDKYINNINIKYENVTVDKYIIMPNHIHMIIFLHGRMWASSPTKNLNNIIGSFKTMVTKETGNSIWQRSYHDHVIRDEKDYQRIWEYIDTNAAKWEDDCFYNA